MSRKSKQSVNVHYMLDEQVSDLIDACSKKTRLSKTALVENAVISYVRSMEPELFQSFFKEDE